MSLLPLVQISIGIPAYNNASTLKRAVDSLLAQTLRPLVIDISDDASTDSTSEVGRALAKQHSCVRYTRQAVNLGPTGNFAFLLHRARTPYFMWLAGDDYILPTYLERTSACLDSRPEVVTCVSKVLFVNEDGSMEVARGSEPLCGTVRCNLARYFAGTGDNARLYGLHRREAVLRAIPPKHIYAWDWAFMAGTLLAGRHEEIPEALMVREWTPTEVYLRQIRRDNHRRLDRIFPLAPMTRDLIFRQHIPLNLKIIIGLLKSNFALHCMYLYHPQYLWLRGNLRRMSSLVRRSEAE